MPLEVPLEPELKTRSDNSKTMPKLIGLYGGQSIDQIFFPQPDILHGVIPSPSDLVNYFISYLLMGHNPLNLILMVLSCNNRVREPLLGPTR